MRYHKVISFALLASLGVPQVSLATELTTNPIVQETIDSDSFELDELPTLITRRPRPNKPHRRKRRRNRKRRIRQEIRGEIRDRRNRRTAARIIRGVIGIGIGAAIAESNRNNRSNSEIIIIERDRELESRGYYDELYKCEHLDQGGYYNADELEACLRGN